MSIRILIANQKGGTGKSTTTVNLAGAFTAAGYSVGVLDTDSQQSTAGLLGLPAHTPSGIRLLADGPDEEAVDVVLADSAPRADEPRMLSFAARANLITLVTQRSYIALLSTQKTYRFLSATYPAARFCILINEDEPRTRLAREVEENLKVLELDKIPLLRSRITKREAYLSSVVEGWHTFAQRNPDAVRELAMVAGELIALASH
jgi:chromosome partitioning protein